MKTAIQWLEDYLNQKVLPCPDGNDYVYGMNVAHENLINYIIPALIEKEKKQIIESYYEGHTAPYFSPYGNDVEKQAEEYYNQTYNQNK